MLCGIHNYINITNITMNINMNNMNKPINVCNNCGKPGHMFHQCKLPITSYGIILFRSSNKGLQFLMIRRKDSFGYIDYLRGKYSPYNINQIQNSVDEMSISEKQKILKEPFDELWKQMWGDISKSQYKSEEYASSRKNDLIKSGVVINNVKFTLQEIVNKSQTVWNETEWEFPKGRRDYKEKDMECALREFEEETGISQSKISVIENVMPFEEIFIGTNHKSYKHKYYLAYMNDTDDFLYNYQKSEVSKMEWKTYNECLESIRPYNLEKKKLIENINKVLQTYRIY
jgi:ADP-ribose pyrophosphatase YjhB (NUDIX family)